MLKAYDKRCLSMVPTKIVCNNCNGVNEVKVYKKIVLCSYCNSEIPFTGFQYREIDKKSSMYANMKKEMDCPACRSPHMFLGSSKKLWKCVDCGYTLPQIQRLFGVFWFCDKCDTFKNIQPGFNTKKKKWICTECGFENSVTRKDIL